MKPFSRIMTMAIGFIIFIGILTLMTFESRSGFPPKRNNTFNMDYYFLREAALNCMMKEILGDIAVLRYHNDNVIDFGRQAAFTHMETNHKLRLLAENLKTDLPAKVCDSRRKKIHQLSKLHGAEFDREYMEVLIESYEGSIRVFKDEIFYGSNDEMRAFAMDELKILNQQLSEAREVRRNIRS